MRWYGRIDKRRMLRLLRRSSRSVGITCLPHRLRSLRADLVRHLRLCGGEVRLYLLGDGFPNVRCYRLHHLVGNVGVAGRFKAPWFICP